MQGSPLLDQAHGGPREPSPDCRPVIDPNQRFIFRIHRVKVRRIVISEIHVDHDSVNSLNRGTPTTHGAPTGTSATRPLLHSSPTHPLVSSRISCKCRLCWVSRIQPAGTPLRVPNGSTGEPSKFRTEPPTTPDEWISPPWPYVLAPSGDALAIVSRLRLAHPAKSATIVGSVYDVASELRAQTYGRSTEEALRLVPNIDLDQWLEDAQASYQYNEEEEDENDFYDPESPLFTRLRWRWAQWVYNRQRVDPRFHPPPHHTWYSKHGLDVVVALLPTADPTEAPAILGFGDFNGCDRPEIHVAFARRLRDKFGAELVTCSMSGVEFTVTRPLGSIRRTATVARELDLYCRDAAGQVYWTRRGVDRHLKDATVWYLWWD